MLKRITAAVRREPCELPWQGKEYDLEDCITYAFGGYKREHIAQVNVFLDRLKAGEDDYYKTGGFL